MAALEQGLWWPGLPVEKRETREQSKRQRHVQLDAERWLRPKAQVLQNQSLQNQSLQNQLLQETAQTKKTTLEPLAPSPTDRVALPGWWLISGGLAGDRLWGSHERELMFGFGGNDVLEGKGGDDCLHGGEGDDLLAGGLGDDHLLGEAGRDVLYGGAGSDRLDGGWGDDRIQAGEGDDWIFLSRGNDGIDGGLGLDTLDTRGWPNATGVSGSKGLTPVAGAVTLRYQVDFVETLVNNKKRTQFLPQSSWLLSFREASPAGAAEGDPITAKQRLYSMEAVLAPKGEANLIDFSFKSIQPVFSVYGNAQAPAIILDLAQGSLKYQEAYPVGAQAVEPKPVMTTLEVQGFRHVTGSFGDDQITGDDQDNVLFGGYGDDLLRGGGGDDLLISNEGDVMTGGLGRDCFQLNAAWEKRVTRVKTWVQAIAPVQIQDFNGSEGDRLYLQNDGVINLPLSAEKSLQYFPFASLVEGAVAPEQFLVLGQGQITAQTRLIYDNGSGELFYRGPEIFNGGLNNRLLVAVLAGAPSLQAADIQVI